MSQGRSKKQSEYAERLFTYPEVGALSLTDVSRALQGPVATQGVAFTPEALAEVYRVTQGYPYFWVSILEHGSALSD